MIINPFKTKRSIGCQHNKQNIKKPHFDKNFHSHKTVNPFDRQFLIAPTTNRAKQRPCVLLTSNKNKSLSLSSLHYTQHFADSRSKSSSKLQRSKFGLLDKLQMQFKKQKQFNIQRQRISLFGPQIFRMKFHEQNRNQEYFGLRQIMKNQHHQKEKSKIFQKSSYMYGNQQKAKTQQIEQKISTDSTKNMQNKITNEIEVKQKKHLKAKKILSWNEALTKTDLPTKIKGKSQKQISQSPIQQQNTNNRAPTFGMIKLGESHKFFNEQGQIGNKQFTLGGRSLKKYDIQKNEDYIIQANEDEFRLQRNSESSNFQSSSSSSNKNFMAECGLMSQNNYHNLNYNSNFSSPSNMNQYKSFESYEKRSLDPKKMSYTSQISQKTNEKVYNHSKKQQMNIAKSFIFDGKTFQLVDL